MNDTQNNGRKIGIVGTGAVGFRLALLLSENGYPVSSVSGRDKERTSELARLLSLKDEERSNSGTVNDSEMVFICLPDDVLRREVKRLGGESGDLHGKMIYHTSGVLSSAVLDPLKSKGALTAGFHPLQTFPRDGGGVTLKNTAVAVEGDNAAVDAAVEIINRLGAYPLYLDPEQKSMYHAAASMASNGLVGLSGVVEEMLDSAGLAEEGREFFYRLMSQSLENSRNLSPGKAITGPAARGDISTLKEHLDSLKKESPHLLPVYVVIGSHCVHLAINGGKLSRQRGEAILDLFSNELQGLTI